MHGDSITRRAYAAFGIFKDPGKLLGKPHPSRVKSITVGKCVHFGIREGIQMVLETKVAVNEATI